MRRSSCGLLLLAAFAAAGGCAHLPSGGVVSATPSAAPTGTGATCLQTPMTGATIVAISPLITPVVDPTYGVLSGYAVVANGNAPNVATPIVVTTTATIQFFNDDVLGSQLHYSAAGIGSVNAFPSPSYTFPPSAATSTGSQIATSSAWSTGFLQGQCYSRTFSIAGPGTYFFGDATYYGLANLRDVIVATTPAP